MRSPRTSVLLILASALAALGCTSTDSGPEAKEEAFVGPPTQVSWLLYKSGQVISLVNESHTNRLELYSEVRDQAGPKVTTDDVMDGLVDFFVDEQHFDDFAQGGPAPAKSEGAYAQALELRIEDRISHIRLGPSTGPEEREAFNACAEALMTIWNLTYQVQAVANPEGEAIFTQPGTRIHYKSR